MSTENVKMPPSPTVGALVFTIETAFRKVNETAAAAGRHIGRYPPDAVTGIRAVIPVFSNPSKRRLLPEASMVDILNGVYYICRFNEGC
jgi:hypothetical protein